MAIAKMIRVFIAGPVDRQAQTLRFLQQLGVLHVEPASEQAAEFELKHNDLLSRVKKIDQLIESLKRFRSTEEVPFNPAPDDELVAYVEGRLFELQELESRQAALKRLREELLIWGDFEPAQISTLEEHGLVIRRYRMDKKNWEAFQPPENVLLEVVSAKYEVLFFTVAQDDTQEIAQANPLSQPEFGLNRTEAELDRVGEKIKSLHKVLRSVAPRIDVLKEQLTEHLNEASYTESMATAYKDTDLFALQGWIPQSEQSTFQKMLESASLPLQVDFRDPVETEEAPVLLRNNWFIQRIEPLLKLYGNPKYRHLDPSYLFAPFMVLFFGICLSDAGYGVLLFLIAHWLGKKMGHKVEGLPLVIGLCKLFALAAVVVGLLTGSIFGYSFQNRGWILMDIDVDFGNPMLLFYLSLGLGVVHLSLSYVMGILQTLYFHIKMQKLGLIFVLWGGVLLIVKATWLAEPSSPMQAPVHFGGIIFLSAGLLLTLLFPNNSKKWGLRLGLGLWNIYGLTGLIGDFLSYARLFGLGIATSAIASVMNQLAGMAVEGLNPIISIPMAIVIIAVGHSFNLALALLGSTVHSARLHFVEAFKNFFEGGGVEYKPFQIKRGSS